MPEPNLLGVAFGWEPSRELLEAINYGVFPHLDANTSRTTDWMAEQCGMNANDMEVVLDALAAMGFVAYSEDGYTCPNPIPPQMLDVASIFAAPELVRMAWAPDQAPGA